MNPEELKDGDHVTPTDVPEAAGVICKSHKIAGMVSLQLYYGVDSSGITISRHAYYLPSRLTKITKEHFDSIANAPLVQKISKDSEEK